MSSLKLTQKNSVGWLVGWVLRHINICWLFNAKSIFMKIVLFQTIQFKCKYGLIVKNISISSYSVYTNGSNSAKYENRFCSHTVNCQNSSMLNNSV